MKTKILTILVVFSLAACDAINDSSRSAAGESDELPTEVAIIEAIVNWDALSVRETPEDKGKYLTAVYQGEKVKLLGPSEEDKNSERKNTYIQVELSDGTTGWVQERFTTVNATAGAIVNETAVYKRPDLLTKSNSKFYRMDFVAIKEVKDDWIQVVGVPAGEPWFTEGWIKSNNATTSDIDVSLAVIYSRATKEKNAAKKAQEIKLLLDNSDLHASQFYRDILASANDSHFDHTNDQGIMEGASLSVQDSVSEEKF